MTSGGMFHITQWVQGRSPGDSVLSMMTAMLMALSGTPSHPNETDTFGSFCDILTQVCFFPIRRFSLKVSLATVIDMSNCCLSRWLRPSANAPAPPAAASSPDSGVVPVAGAAPESVGGSSSLEQAAASRTAAVKTITNSAESSALIWDLRGVCGSG